MERHLMLTMGPLSQATVIPQVQHMVVQTEVDQDYGRYQFRLDKLEGAFWSMLRTVSQEVPQALANHVNDPCLAWTPEFCFQATMHCISDKLSPTVLPRLWLRLERYGPLSMPNVFFLPNFLN